MRDPNPQNDKDGEKYWVTKEDEVHRLYQFDNKSVFRKDEPSK